MDFTKLACPVCGKQFKEDDDIVVCPVCGTPHHRECYDKSGGCINSDIHDRGYVYQSNDKTIVEENFTDENNDAPDDILPGESEEDAEKRKQIEEFKQIAFDINYADKKEVTIAGQSSHIYERALGKKSDYYLSRFLYFDKLGRKIMFNFAAFLCPLAWACYRRVYKLVALILAFYALSFAALYIPVATNAELNEAMNTLYEQEGVEGMMKAYSYVGSENGELTAVESAFLEAAEKAAPPKAVSVSLQISGYVMRVAVSLFGTYMYFCTTKNRIDKICKTAPDRGAANMLAIKECRTSPGLMVIALIIDILFFI